MSQPKRYRGLTFEEKCFGGLKPPFHANLVIDQEGNLVAWSDYAALAAENERLRKAGDAMAKSLAFEYPNSPKVAAWNAAKEGRDAK